MPGVPFSSSSSASRPSPSGKVRSTTGRTPVASQNAISRRNSSSVPMVEPITEICRKNSRCRSADGSAPAGGAAADDHAARPDRAHRVRPGGPADGFEDAVDPFRQPGALLEDLVRARGRRPVARPCSEREVTQTRMPIARPSWISAVDTPPLAPCTRMVDPAGNPLRVTSIRYAVR